MPDLLPLAEQPRPIVLDPALRTPLAAKLVANAAAGRSHRPLICTTATEEAVRASALSQCEHVEVVRLPRDSEGESAARFPSELDSIQVSSPS